MKTLASLLTSFQYRSWNITFPLVHSSMRSGRLSLRNGEYPHSRV